VEGKPGYGQHIAIVHRSSYNPIRVLLLVGDEAGRLRAVDWTDYEERMVRLLRLHYGMHGYELAPAHNPNGLSDKMLRFFDGDLHAIDDIETATAGTPFQRSVWNELRNIPTGSVISYGTLAQIGRSSAARAVGLANGSNPIGIVVPCHRVIGSDGALTGYGGDWNVKGGCWITKRGMRRVSPLSSRGDG
jgi:methylated-DNA-[protein]-cysteine S-methyltransferase